MVEIEIATCIITGSLLKVFCASWTSQEDDEEAALIAKLEELHVEAVSQGVEWLRRALSEFRKDELRALAAAANVVTHGPDGSWLTMVQLRSALLKVLVPATEAGVEKYF